MSKIFRKSDLSRESEASKRVEIMIGLDSKLKKSINFIACLSEYLGYSPSTMYKAISLLIKFLEKSRRGEFKEMQIYAITSLLVASKLHEMQSLSIIDMNSFTNQNYNRGQFLSAEFEFYTTLNFKFDTCSWESNPNNVLQILLKMSEKILPESKFELILKTSQIILFCCMNEEDLVEKVQSPILMIVSVIHTSLIVLTHFSGQFPLTWRLSSLIKLEEAKIMSFSNVIMKYLFDDDILQNVDLEF